MKENLENLKRKEPHVLAEWLAIFNGQWGCFFGGKILKLRILLWILRALNAGASGIREMFPYLKDKLESIKCTPFPYDKKSKKYILPEKQTYKNYKWNELYFEALDFICLCMRKFSPDPTFWYDYADHCGTEIKEIDGKKISLKKFNPWYLNNLGIDGYNSRTSKAKFVRETYWSRIILILNDHAEKGLRVIHGGCNEPGDNDYIQTIWDWYLFVKEKMYIKKGHYPEEFIAPGFQNDSIYHKNWKKARKYILWLAGKNPSKTIPHTTEIKNYIDGLNLSKDELKNWGYRIRNYMITVHHQIIANKYLTKMAEDQKEVTQTRRKAISNDGDKVSKDKNGNRIRHTGKYIKEYYYDFIRKVKNVNYYKVFLTREWIMGFLCWDNTFKCEGLQDFADLVWKPIFGKKLHNQGKYEKEIAIVEKLIKEDETQDVDLNNIFLKKHEIEEEEKLEKKEKLEQEKLKKEKKRMKNIFDFKGFFEIAKDRMHAPMFIFCAFICMLFGYIIRLLINLIKK